ncbi:MAG: hypothetical protein WD273_07665 [Trueperaceae bacterium]
MATPNSVPRRMAAHLLLLLSLLLFSSVLAQDLPRVQLDATRFEVGEAVTLSATDLTPDEQYLLTIDGPDDETIEEALTADDDGNLSHTFELEAAGEWTLHLSGEGVSASVVLDVAAPGTSSQDGQVADEAGAEEQSPEEQSPREQSPEEQSGEERGGQDLGGQELGGQEEPVTVTTDGDAVVGMRDGSRVWRFDFPAGSGSTGAVLETGTGVWVGHGNSLILIEPQSGQAQARYPMPGQVIRLEPMGDAVSVVSDIGRGLRQRIEVDEEGPGTTVRFGVDQDVFEWLRNEAHVPDSAARLEIDPTNAWLHLVVGLSHQESSSRRQHLEEALQRGTTFYDRAGMAQELYDAGEIELAGDAMDLALQDFAGRGYDPQLLTSDAMRRAYYFPLAPLESALTDADLDTAGFWAPWLYLVSSEEAPATRAALLEYSRQLAAVGQRDAASLWRDRATAGRSASPAASLDRFFLGLGRSGWYAVAALLAAILALHVTLIAKYWAPQTLAIRRGRETGGNRRPWSRLFAIRYYSFTEKLVLVLLFAACLALLGLTRWYDAAGDRPLALASGTLASPVARDVVSSSPLEGPRAAFIEGYAAQVAGEETPAREEYLAAGDYPPALNNLAALIDDDVLYQRALELAPGMPEASFNLGRTADPSPFHAAYQSAEPLLAVPGSGDFRTAISGSWQRAVGATFENPWRALRGMEFFAVPSLVWQILLALFLSWILITVVWLLIPRPALARNAPRTGAYHLLALLIPGSGLADEAWGVLLMVPWALLGVDALAQWLGWERSLGLPLETELWALAAIYVVNLIAFVVEYVSYRRRMRELRRRHPESVEAYGLSS